MNRERLTKLLETVIWLRDATNAELQAVTPQASFDFDNFCDDDDPACGSHMCLAGWYVFRNPDAGLRLVGGNHGRGGIVQVDSKREAATTNTETWETLGRHFGLQSVILDYLFMAPEFDDFHDLADDDDGDNFWDLNLEDRKFWAGRAAEQLRILLAADDETLTIPALRQVLVAKLQYVWSDRFPQRV